MVTSFGPDNPTKDSLAKNYDSKFMVVKNKSRSEERLKQILWPYGSDGNLRVQSAFRAQLGNQWLVLDPCTPPPSRALGLFHVGIRVHCLEREEQGWTQRKMCKE